MKDLQNIVLGRVAALKMSLWENFCFDSLESLLSNNFNTVVRFLRRMDLHQRERIMWEV